MRFLAQDDCCLWRRKGTKDEPRLSSAALQVSALLISFVLGHDIICEDYLTSGEILNAQTAYFVHSCYFAMNTTQRLITVLLEAIKFRMGSFNTAVSLFCLLLVLQGVLRDTVTQVPVPLNL